MDQTTTPTTYYQQRMDALGVNASNNFIGLWQSTKHDDPEHHGENVLRPFPIFREVNNPAHPEYNGIEILVYTIGRSKLRFSKTFKRKSGDVEGVDKDYTITRLETPIKKKDGKEIKYLMPKDQPVNPFFPPELVEKFDRKEHIPVLYLTEGYFKAFKADMHGIACVGVPSITCLRNKDTEELHSDIQLLIRTCRVERLVWLLDGDCRNITTDEITAQKDLYQRPRRFFDTVRMFYDLTSKFEGVTQYVSHVNTDDLDGHPKGLDDLLCSFKDEAHDIMREAHDFSKQGTKGVTTGRYFVRINIAYNLTRINQYFFLNDVNQFYAYHAEKREDLRKADAFKYNGTLYKYDEKDAVCKVEIPGDASRYFRVGDDYYEWVEIPNRDGTLERTYRLRLKSTITDDYGKGIIKHIVKYKDFCIVPSHTDYQPVKDYCFNRYFPLRPQNEPEAGDYSVTLEFIKHIFGDEEVSYVDKDTKEIHRMPRWQVGLDYLQIMYLKPIHILPILCLVSSERSTGKTTFVDWLNDIYGENVVNVGNSDLQNDFNAHWTPKLIVACDETKIDKLEVVEKVKRLSTSRKVVQNAKGKNQVSTDFFAKFIFLSNNTRTFLTIDEEEIRFWVIEVPHIANKNKDFLEVLRDEIPAFLHFLMNRTLATKAQERHHFDTDLLKSKVLEELKHHSKPQLEKRIESALKDLFEMANVEEITIPTQGILDMLKNVEDTYLKRTLKNMGFATERPQRVKYPRIEKDNISGTLGAQAEYGYTIKWLASTPTTFWRFPRARFTDVPVMSDEEFNKPAAEIKPAEGAGSTSNDLPF